MKFYSILSCANQTLRDLQRRSKRYRSHVVLSAAVPLLPRSLLHRRDPIRHFLLQEANIWALRQEPEGMRVLQLKAIPCRVLVVCRRWPRYILSFLKNFTSAGAEFNKRPPRVIEVLKLSITHSLKFKNLLILHEDLPRAASSFIG